MYLSSTVKEDKVLLPLGHTGISRGSLFLSPSGTQIHTRGGGDASADIGVLPLCKLKPLITSWESKERQRREGDGWRQRERRK